MFKFIDVKYKDILDLPTLCIEKEKITTLVGTSGSGKTTILRMLNKMLSPTQGKILFKGIDLSTINSVDHRRCITMLTQNPAIFEGTIRDNLNIGLKFQEKELPGDDVLIKVLEQVKLDLQLDNPAHLLSGGERQRLALGRILLLNSQVYLLDEPSSALDEETAEIIIQGVTEHVRKENKTMIMVTHSQTIAERYSDTIIEISNGKVRSRREYTYEQNN